jgi:cysteine-rich repeat protein
MRKTIALLAVTMVGACAGQPPSLIQDSPVVICGNGTVEGDEVCDDGNTVDGDQCSADCSSGDSQGREGCGNGTVEAGETCDDGNQIAGDGCSGDCSSNERCGNGIRDTSVGETCDDGNTTGGDGCSASCQSNEGCGNFTVDGNEGCDAGPNGSSTCDVNCTPALCGDGTVNSFRGEQCDGGPNGDASCDTDCTPAFCGDLTVNAARGESCDDGNAVNTDACVACKVAVCGDGFVRPGVEQCDDSNTANGDGCNSTCQIEQQPRVYILNNLSCNPQTQQCSSNQLLGFIRDCGGADGDVTNPYDNCSNQPTGFTWVDSTPFQPSRVTIEVNNGIHSDFNGNPTTLTAVTNLNGTASGNFALNPNPGGNQCNPTEVLNTWTLTNVAGYKRNQQNTLSIAGMGFTPQGVSKCFGVSFTNAFNGFVRITVFP